MTGSQPAGVDRIFVVVGYRHDLIENYFQNWHLALEFRLQQPVNGTGSAAQLAREFAAGDPFLLTYGDILCEPAEYARCGSILLQHRAAAAVAVKAVDDPWQGAAVYEDHGRILEIIEKPPKGTSSTHWNSAGFYAFQPVLFDYLDRLQPSARNEYELTSALHDMLTHRPGSAHLTHRGSLARCWPARRPGSSKQPALADFRENCSLSPARLR